MQYDIEDKRQTKVQRSQKLVYNIQSSPSLKRETNSKLPSQASKLNLVKWFGENIYKLVLGINVVQIDITFLIVVMQEVKADFYVLCF
jgi:hypothetical protein